MTETPSRRRRTTVLALLAVVIGLLTLLVLRSAHDDTSGDDDAFEAAQPRGHVQVHGQESAHDPASAHSRSPGLKSMAATSNDDERCGRERSQQHRLLRDRIDPIMSPDLAVTHALLSSMLAEGEQDALQLQREIENAVERWPNDADVAWLAYETCNENAGCNREAVLEHLTRVDGSNAYSWLHAIAWAHSEKSNVPRLIHHAAHAPAYDSRAGTSFMRLRPLLLSVPLPASCTTSTYVEEFAESSGKPLDAALLADMEASAVEFARSMAVSAILTRTCDPQRNAMPGALRTDCRVLLSRMANGENMLEQGVGLARLLELSWDQTTAERYRRYKWLISETQRIGEFQEIDGYLWRIWAEGEVNVLRLHAEQNGRWPPPDDWLPDDEESRRRILGD